MADITTKDLETMDRKAMEQVLKEVTKTVNQYLASNDPERNTDEYRKARKARARILTHINKEQDND